jgi:hypothetical protein
MCPVQKNYNQALPKGPPEGYTTLKSPTPSVGAKAKQLLKEWAISPFGTSTPFEIDNISYMARKEPHYHSPESGKTPVGWHSGITVYIAKNQQLPAPTSTTTPASEDSSKSQVATRDLDKSFLDSAIELLTKLV